MPTTVETLRAVLASAGMQTAAEMQEWTPTTHEFLQKFIKKNSSNTDTKRSKKHSFVVSYFSVSSTAIGLWYS
jgi:hypothetical protein